MARRSLTTGYLWPQNTTDVVATSAVTPKHPPTARNCHGNPFARNDLRAVRIRGVRPAASLKRCAACASIWAFWAHRGVRPAASLKRAWSITAESPSAGYAAALKPFSAAVRGVRPAASLKQRHERSVLGGGGASAGYAPRPH